VRRAPINWYLTENPSKFRIGAVSYLNTVPLVWGMLHGIGRAQVELSFSVPCVCAEEVAQDTIQIGLVPVVEIARQALEIVPGVGITCLGAVRSILLFSRVPWRSVRTLAADLCSRSSVELARVILRERYGVQPQVVAHVPVLDEMLSKADAALVIGDPALRLVPERLPFECLDLGHEWFLLTGLPMVFAAWGGKPGIPVEALRSITTGSYAFGKAQLSEIIEHEYQARGITRDLADRYLRHHIRFELGPKEQEGLDTFLNLAGLSRPILAAST
jgi:chorismate dehydratase